MINKNKIIDTIQKNIALSNFESELKSNNKEFTHEKKWRINDMKKIVLTAICYGLMVVGGIAYAYNNGHFKLSKNLLGLENSYSWGLGKIDSSKDKGENKNLYLNGSLIVGQFNHIVEKNTKYESVHKGIDLAAPKGTKVFAAVGGIIKETNYTQEYGKYIIIEHEEGYETLYAHLDKINVKEGDNVSQGEKIGTSGITGNVVAPILHFELRHNGEPVNPLDYMN